MFRRNMLLAAMVLLSTHAAAAQNGDLDSLVSHFIDRGALSRWQPHLLFQGCPSLTGAQQQGISRLMAARLSRQRIDDLAKAWMIPLQNCKDARLESWYFAQLDKAISAGEGENVFGLWFAIDHADSRRIRDHLRAIMADSKLPMPIRNMAGGSLFARIRGEEQLTEYLKAFRAKELPNEVAWAQTEQLLNDQPERLLSEVGNALKVDPFLFDQPAFQMIVESSARYASAPARRELAEALIAGLESPGLTTAQRDRIKNAANVFTHEK